MFETVHDRLLARLANAGARSRFLQDCDKPGGDGCPLDVVLKAVQRDELEALAAIVAVRPVSDVPFVRYSWMPSYAPVRRLLEPLMHARRPADAFASDWAKTTIANRVQGADDEAFKALVDALEREQARRTQPNYWLL